MPELTTEGVTLARGDAASPEVFTTIGQVVSLQGPGGSATVIDTTNLSSTSKEKAMGLPDEGQITAEMNLDTDDTAQTGLRTDRDAKTLRNFKITLTDSSPATTLTFAAYVLSFVINSAVDDVIKASVTLEISGAVTWA